jgi:hypothetical protein
MRWMLMGTAGVALAASAALAGSAATRREPEAAPAPAVRPVEPPVQQLGPYHTYWRDDRTLWVYSALPELGMNTFLGDADKFQKMRAAGVRIARMDLPWDATMEDRPFHYTEKFYGFRWAVQNAVRQGVTPLVLVHWNHGSPRAPGLQEGTDFHARFNRRLAAYMAEAARAFPEVLFWQVWNEPDGGYWGQMWGGWDNSVQQFPRREQGRRYAATLRAVYPAIKEANPRAWVLTAGLTGTERMVPNRRGGHDVAPAVSWEFLRGMYEAGAAPYFDFMAVHSYRDVAAIGTSIRRQVDAHEGRPGRPLWLTEFGAEGSDAAQQAWWRAALDDIEAPGTPFTKAMGFTLWLGERNSLGIFNPDWTPRSTYTHLQRRDFNQRIRTQGSGRGTVRVRAPDRDPVLPFRRDGEWVEISNVQIDGRFPTAIRFRPRG